MAGLREAQVEAVWTWGDGLSFHTLRVKFILAQEMLDPFQRHTGLQAEGVSQPWKLCLSYTHLLLPLLAPNFLGEAGPPEGPDAGAGSLLMPESWLAPTAKDRVHVGKRRLSPELGFPETLPNSDSKWPMSPLTSFILEQFFIMPNGPPLIPITLPDYPLTLNSPINLPKLH